MTIQTNSRTIVIVRQYIAKLSIGLLLIFLLGCAHQTPRLTADAQKDAQADIEAQTPPNVDLDAQLLTHLLAANYSSYNNDWRNASHHTYQAAVKSQDYRLAETAAILSAQFGDSHSAELASQLWLKLSPLSEAAKDTALVSQLNNIKNDADLNLAIAELTKLLTSEAKDNIGIKKITRLVLRQSNPKTAVKIMQHFIDAQANSAQTLLSASYVAQIFKTPELETQWLTQAAALDPSSEVALKMQASALGKQKKTEQRTELISNFVKRNPKTVAIRLIQANDLSRLKNHEAAFELVQKILIDAPSDETSLMFAAALADYTERPELSKKYYKTAIKHNPKNDDARWLLARLAVTEERYADAQKLYSQITDDTLLFDAQLQSANMIGRTKSAKAAVAWMDRIKPVTKKEYVEYVMTRHYLLMNDKSYDDALGYLNDAIFVIDQSEQFIYSRAMVAVELGQVELAEQDLRALITQHPDHADALNALGYTLADQTERYDEAKALISKALSLEPNSAHILDSMGWVLYRMKDLPNALIYLQKAYAESPEAEIAAHLGEVLWESGKPEDAKKLWQAAVIEDSKNAVLKETIRHYAEDM